MLAKEGDIVAGGLDPGQLRAAVDRHGGVWNEIILSETREEFFDACRRLAPRALLCSFTSLKCYADWKYRDIPEPYRSPVNLEFQPEVVEGLREWVESTLTGIEEVSDLARRAFACTAPPPFGRSPGGGLVHC